MQCVVTWFLNNTRVEQALDTLLQIERIACDQHDHVSFAKAWMLASRGVAHALDCNFRLAPRGVVVPLQRRLEGGLQNTVLTLFGCPVTESAWVRAKLPTCYGGLGIRVAQMGVTAHSTFWSAVGLHLAVMPRIWADRLWVTT